MCPRRPRTSDPATTDAAAEPDDALEAEETGPLRRCIVTRERADPSGMIRFVVGPDLALVPDLARKLPGRGIWLSARRDVLEAARTKNAFARAARARVTVPPDLAAVIETGLTRRVVELLGFARRAGQAVCGFAKARELIASERCGLVVQAHDGSVDERARLLSGAGALEIVTPLDAATLGVAFGRDHIVHVAIAAGRLAGSIATESGRLAGLKGEPAIAFGGIFKQAGA